MSHTEQTHHYVKNRSVQVCRKLTDEAWHRAFIVANLVVFFILPLVVIIFLYGCIIARLVSDSDGVLQGGKVMTSQQRSQRKQIIFMLLSVIVIFFVCVLPFRVFSVWLIFASHAALHRMGLEAYLNLINFARVMFYLNSACNPVLYSMFSSKFRSAFRRLCAHCVTSRREQRHDSSSNGKTLNQTEELVLNE